MLPARQIGSRGHRQDRRAAAHAGDVGERPLGLRDVLEHLESDDEVDAASTNGMRVASPKNIGTSISSHSSARSVSGRSSPTTVAFGEALDEAFGDAALAGADLDHDLGLQPVEHAIEGGEEAVHHPPLDRVLRGVLVVGVAGDVVRLHGVHGAGR